MVVIIITPSKPQIWQLLMEGYYQLFCSNRTIIGHLLGWLKLYCGLAERLQCPHNFLSMKWAKNIVTTFFNLEQLQLCNFLRCFFLYTTATGSSYIGSWFFLFMMVKTWWLTTSDAVVFATDLSWCLRAGLAPLLGHPVQGHQQRRSSSLLFNNNNNFW